MARIKANDRRSATYTFGKGVTIRPVDTREFDEMVTDYIYENEEVLCEDLKDFLYIEDVEEFERSGKDFTVFFWDDLEELVKNDREYCEMVVDTWAENNEVSTCSDEEYYGWNERDFY